MVFPHRKRHGIAPIAAIAFAVGCGGGGSDGITPPPPPPPPPSSSVSITTGSAPPPRFIPVSTELAVGGTVTWTNGSPVVHDLVATTNNWQLSRTLDPQASFQTTVGEAGSYRYRCTLHEGMNGSIEVR